MTPDCMCCRARPRRRQSKFCSDACELRYDDVRDDARAARAAARRAGR